MQCISKCTKIYYNQYILCGDFIWMCQCCNDQTLAEPRIPCLTNLFYIPTRNMKGSFWPNVCPVIRYPSASYSQGISHLMTGYGNIWNRSNYRYGPYMEYGQVSSHMFALMWQNLEIVLREVIIPSWVLQNGSLNAIGIPGITYFQVSSNLFQSSNNFFFFKIIEMGNYCPFVRNIH